MKEKLPTIADYEDIHECKIGWISVEDRLPEKEGDYLVYGDTWRVKIKVLKFDRHSDKSIRLRFWWSGSECNSVTYWMPLPSPPKNKE